jgi:riboflavin kinase/FMN adenylyltransferase
MVTHGAGRGAKIGFPTATLEAIDTLLPAHGVYAARAYTTSGHWPAAVNIGPNPTFGEQIVKVEVHLLGFSGALYGQPLEIAFLSRLRSVQPFESLELLKAQLTHDVAAAQQIAEELATK